MFDLDMAERLNALALAHHMTSANNSDSASYNPDFNPRSVSFDVRTPQELAAVNEFLVTLGRDVAAGTPRRAHPQQAGGMNADEFTRAQTYFDTASLNQLGLSGMPGMPGSGASYSDAGLPSGSGSAGSMHYPHRHGHGFRAPLPTQPGQFTSLYPTVHDSFSGSSYPDDFRSLSHEYEYASTPYQRSPQSRIYSSPPHDTMHSPHSSMSTPSNATPPHIPDLSAFAFMREPRGAPPAAHIGLPSYSGMRRTDIVSLKTAPGSTSAPPGPVEPRLTKPVHRGPPARLTQSGAAPLASSSSSKPGSLYPLLTSGDLRYKLAPLNRAYRSPSPASMETDSSSPRSSASSSPHARNVALPGIQSIAPIPMRSHSGSDELVQRVGEIELDRERKRAISEEERKKHAELIRDLLVSINGTYKSRFGTPPRVKEEEQEDMSMNLAAPMAIAAA